MNNQDIEMELDYSLEMDQRASIDICSTLYGTSTLICPSLYIGDIEINLDEVVASPNSIDNEGSF